MTITLILVALGLFLLSTITLVVVYFYRRKFTKERFAFFAVSSLCAFAAVTIIPLFTGNSFFIIVELIAKEIL